MVYAIQVELLERRVATQQLGAMFAISMGAEGVTVPDVDKVRADFDTALVSEPEAIDQEDSELMAALGVGG